MATMFAAAAIFVPGEFVKWTSKRPGYSSATAIQHSLLRCRGMGCGERTSQMQGLRQKRKLKLWR